MILSFKFFQQISAKPELRSPVEFGTHQMSINSRYKYLIIYVLNE